MCFGRILRIWQRLLCYNEQLIYISTYRWHLLMLKTHQQVSGCYFREIKLIWGNGHPKTCLGASVVHLGCDKKGHLPWAFKGAPGMNLSIFYHKSGCLPGLGLVRSAPWPLAKNGSQATTLASHMQSVGRLSGWKAETLGNKRESVFLFVPWLTHGWEIRWQLGNIDFEKWLRAEPLRGNKSKKRKEKLFLSWHARLFMAWTFMSWNSRSILSHYMVVDLERFFDTLL